jgi:hypothetical protein
METWRSYERSRRSYRSDPSPRRIRLGDMIPRFSFAAHCDIFVCLSRGE